MKDIEKRREFIINTTYFAIIAIIIYITIKYLFALLLPFIIGFAIVFIMRPIVTRFSKKTHLSQKIMAVFFVLLFYGICALLFSWIGLRIFLEVKAIMLELPQTYKSSIEPAINIALSNINQLIEGLEPSTAKTVRNMIGSLSDSLGTIISNFSNATLRAISSTVSSIPSLLIVVVLSIISSLFFAIDYEKIESYVKMKFPNKVNKIVIEAKAFAVEIGPKYVKGYFILMCVTFLELSLGLLLLKVKGSILLAALIAILDILPLIGTGGVVIPWIILSFINGNTSLAVGLLVLYLIITIVRNILEPKIVGEQIGLHPLIMLTSIFIGAKIFGFSGIIALPIGILVIKHLYDKDKLHF